MEHWIFVIHISSHQNAYFSSKCRPIRNRLAAGLHPDPLVGWLI